MTHRFQPAVLLRGPISVFCCYYLSSICLYLSIVATGLCIYMYIQKNEKKIKSFWTSYISKIHSVNIWATVYYIYLAYFFSAFNWIYKKKSIYGYLIALFSMTHPMDESEIFIFCWSCLDLNNQFRLMMIIIMNTYIHE